jgi:hypothetical protein
MGIDHKRPLPTQTERRGCFANPFFAHSCFFKKPVPRIIKLQFLIGVCFKFGDEVLKKPARRYFTFLTFYLQTENWQNFFFHLFYFCENSAEPLIFALRKREYKSLLVKIRGETIKSEECFRSRRVFGQSSPHRNRFCAILTTESGFKKCIIISVLT